MLRDIIFNWCTCIVLGGGVIKPRVWALTCLIVMIGIVPICECKCGNWCYNIMQVVQSRLPICAWFLGFR